MGVGRSCLLLVAPKNYHKKIITCAFLLLQKVTIAACMIIIKQRTHIIIEESKGMMMDVDGSACYYDCDKRGNL